MAPLFHKYVYGGVPPLTYALNDPVGYVQIAGALQLIETESTALAVCVVKRSASASKMFFMRQLLIGVLIILREALNFNTWNAPVHE